MTGSLQKVMRPVRAIISLSPDDDCDLDVIDWKGAGQKDSGTL